MLTIKLNRIYCPNPIQWTQYEKSNGDMFRTQYPCGDVENCKACARWRGLQFENKFYNRLANANLDSLDNMTTITIKVNDGDIEYPLLKKYVKERIRRVSKKLGEDIHNNKLLQFNTSGINYLINGDISDEFMDEFKKNIKYDITSVESRPANLSILKRVIGSAYKNYHFTGLLYGLEEKPPINDSDKLIADEFIKTNKPTVDDFIESSVYTNKLIRTFGEIGYTDEHIVKILLDRSNSILDYIAEQHDDYLLLRQMKNTIKYNHTELREIIAKSDTIDISSDDFVMEEVVMCTQCFKVDRESTMRNGVCFTCNKPMNESYHDGGISIDDFDFNMDYDLEELEAQLNE